MTHPTKGQHFRSMPLLSFAQGCSASLSRLKETEPLPGQMTVLQQAAKNAGCSVIDGKAQIVCTEMTDSGGGR
jgi:hypothetical protein